MLKLKTNLPEAPDVLSLTHTCFFNPGLTDHLFFLRFLASTNSKSLAHLKPVVKAEDGIRGRTKICHGKNAEHLYIEVSEKQVFVDGCISTILSLHLHTLCVCVYVRSLLIAALVQY